MSVSSKHRREKKKSSKTLSITEHFVTGIESLLNSQGSGCDLTESSESDTEEESDDDLEQKMPGQDIVHLGVEEFSLLTEEILQKSSKTWDTTIPEKIRKHKIDSKGFESMSEEQRNNIFPTIGDRIRIQKEWQNVKYRKSETRVSTNRSCYEHIRRFDRPSSERLKYKQNNQIYCSVFRPGDLITPVHMYVDLNGYKYMVPWEQKFLNFSAACMNDRTNGTFYIGATETGEIMGCDLDIQSLDSKLIELIKESFKEHQVETALKCIRPPQCIDVIQNTASKGTLHVIEIDVVPYSKTVADQIFPIKNKKTKNYVFYRYIEGKINKLSSVKIAEYMQSERDALIEQRITAEKQKNKHRNKNLDKRLRDFFCCGEENYEESLYPILVLSHTPKSKVEQLADGELFRAVPWRSVFDFNQREEDFGLQNCLEKTYFHSFLTYITDDFNQRKRDEMSIKLNKETLMQSPIPAWIYCNEVEESDKSARNWLHSSGEGFRKALEFHSDLIPDDRARIIIPLFEKENEELTVAIGEILYKFRKQVLILSPNRSTAANCYDTLSRNSTILPPNCSLDELFLIGLQWKQVNECISRIIKPAKISKGIQIPTSNGGLCTMNPQVVNELSDIEIIGVNECEELKNLPDDERNLREQKVREEYYQGGTAQWQNFYFHDQVLVRDIHKDLENYVRQSLEEYDNEGLAVDKVAVYHQPGSGGSTTSKQILWNMKSDYKCCVVKHISNQTCDQIGRFRTEGEQDDDENYIKPVLVLLDSNNDESIAQFVENLEKESINHNCDVFCVLLICFRVSVLPLDRPMKSVLLKQELSTGENGELNWFKNKHMNLLKKFKNNKGCDPRNLLSFNIMKENFNMESINNSVKEFVSHNLITAEHRKLLKHLAFFNGYDLNFQSIPISCFDHIMSQKTPSWVKHVPPPMRVLTSQDRRQGYGGQCSAIRISNFLLSKPVLNVVLKVEKEIGAELGLSIGEVALSVMHSHHFREKSCKHENGILKNILGDIVKKRDRCPENGGQVGKFSPLITELLDQKDTDQALQIMSLACEITEDPLVAQQLARLNAELKNWKAAHKAIDEAISKRKNNSYFSHTKGQLYKDQMLSSFLQFSVEGAKFPKKHVPMAVTLACKAIDSYRESQTLSESQDFAQPNPAGYESEILMTIELFRLLNCCIEIRPLTVLYDPLHKLS